MIFYFSGTGNSRYVAEKIAELTSDQTFPITCNVNNTMDLHKGDENFGLVFPVYSWGPPLVVERFIKSTDFAKINPSHSFCIMTCGDDCGETEAITRKLIKTKSFIINSFYSIQMPNTYVCLPGFDVDAHEVEQKKISNAQQRIRNIVQSINKKEFVSDVFKGTSPWAKSYLIRPIFNHILVKDRWFKTNSACTLCKTCIHKCPTHNISIKNEKLIWNDNCTGCLACYHNCRNHAIQFGPFTKKKGQYRMK